MSNTFQRFFKDPFLFVDNLKLKIGFIDFNIYKNFVKLRKSIFLLSVISIIGWIIMGFDSSPLQILNPLAEIIQGKYSVNDFWERYNYYYGKEMHWSAIVIYGLSYWWLSRYFDRKLYITKSRNVCYSAGITFFTIGIFEWFWLFCFAIFQNQWWVITPKMPQLGILLRNAFLLSAGAITILYMWADSYIIKGKEIIGRKYKFRLNNKTLMLFLLSILFTLLWIYYPFPVKRLTVKLKNGEIWVNSNYFPQTLYTIKTDPESPINAGEWFWIEDNLIHAINTIVKTLWTFTIVYIFSIEKVSKYGRKYI